jgi:hypothetical protein
LDNSNADAKALGSQMIFVTLDEGVEEPLGDLASRWKEVRTTLISSQAALS